MTRGRRLVEAFAAAASRYAPEDEPRKRALLADLEGVAVRDAGTLLRLHEALCFLQAYPDNAKMLEHVDRALERFGARVHRLGTAARPRLHDSGVTHTILDYPFGFPMARWLAARFPRESDVAWPAFADADRLDETLSLLATAAEGDAFSEGGSAGGSGFASPRAAAEVFLMLPGSSPAPDRRPAWDQQLRRRGRRPPAAPGHHGRHPRRPGRHQRRARPRALDARRGAGRLAARGPSSRCDGEFMNRRRFEALVEKAMRRLPKRFKDKIANIAVVVEDWADDETLADVGVEPPDTLYGLYRGIDLTRRDSGYGNVLPDTITIYQGPIEEDCADEAEIEELVRDTVVHELGHYFGLDDETMEQIEDSEP